nr:hypothetical protein [Arabidopsis thaliana]
MRDLTTAMSDLPRDLEEEVLSRVQLASLRAVRTTCKKWNRRLSKYRFTKKYIRKSRSATADKEFLAIMMLDSSLYLMNVVIDKIDNENNVESSIERKEISWKNIRFSNLIIKAVRFLFIIGDFSGTTVVSNTDKVGYVFFCGNYV